MWMINLLGFTKHTNPIRLKRSSELNIKEAEYISPELNIKEFWGEVSYVFDPSLSACSWPRVLSVFFILLT